MKSVKHLLRPERLREVPEQFSWIDQALVQGRWIDRLDARMAALYLFLVTVADAQGLSYYGAATLAERLHMSAGELDAARQQLIKLELIAYQAPLYQVLALPRSLIQPAVTAPEPPRTATRTPDGSARIAELRAILERGRA